MIASVDFTYWPDITRIFAFSIYGLILGLKSTMVYAMYKNRCVHASQYVWKLRALYFFSKAIILTGFVLLLVGRIGHHVPLNIPSFICYYVGCIITIVLLAHGIRTERQVSAFIQNGVYAVGAQEARNEGRLEDQRVLGDGDGHRRPGG